MTTKFNIGDKVKIKRGFHKGKIGIINGIADYRLYGRRTYIVLIDNKFEHTYVSYELEKLPKNHNQLKETYNKKVILEFDESPYKYISIEDKLKLDRVATKITVNGQVVKNRYGDSDAKTIDISLDEATQMYKEGGKLREFALKAYTEEELNPKPKIPHTWKEYCDNIYPYEKHMHYTPEFAHGFKKEDCDALIAYGRLIRLRRAWIKDWKPIWNGICEKWCIEAVGENSIEVKCLYHSNSPLSFPTQEVANNFLECFKDLLVKARGLY